MSVCNLRILSVGHGDLTLKFDKTNPEDRKRASEVITDLIRKGYAIMVEAGKNDKGPLYSRVRSFDPDSWEYTVMGNVTGEGTQDALPKKVGRPRSSHPVSASSPVVAVARTAGGYDPILPSRIQRGAAWPSR